MPARRTQLLALLLIASLATAGLAYGRFDKLRGDAHASARDLQSCRRELADLLGARAAGGAAVPVSPDMSALNRRLRDAAGVATVPDKLVSIEPGSATHLGETDYSELLVFLRFEPVTIRQLATFLQELSASDPSARPKSIELGDPKPGDGGDLWSADVAIAYLIYSPRASARR